MEVGMNANPFFFLSTKDIYNISSQSKCGQNECCSAGKPEETDGLKLCSCPK